MRISGSNAGYTMSRGSVKGTGYPLHSPISPSLPLPCVTVSHHISTGLYQQKLQVHLNRQGASVQPTTGSRGVRISGSNAGYTMFLGSVKSTGYPLHSSVSPSLPLPASPCAITFQLQSTICTLSYGALNINIPDKEAATGTTRP